MLAAKDKPQALRDSLERKGQGAVSADIGIGEIFLRDKHKKDYRLRWEKDQGKQPRWLPPGEYKILGYRLRRGDWMISSTAGSKRIQVELGKTSALELDTSVTIEAWIQPNKEGPRVGMNVTGHGDAGVSIYLKGRRIPVLFEVLDDDGKKVAEGTLEYG